MTIAMQGLWTVSVKSKSAAWPQRFRIDGSTNGADGVYDETSPSMLVNGPQWGITVEHDPPGAETWRQSRYRMANFRVSGGQFLFDIETDDYGLSGGDEDFNDIILTCAMSMSVSEYVVYGKVKSYSGVCLLNPCFPRSFYVIDTLWQLKELLQYEPMRRIIEKLYPGRVKAVDKIKLGPQPEPPDFTPMMIPSGLSEDPGLTVVRSAKAISESDVKRSKNVAAKMAEAAKSTTCSLAANTTAGNLLLEKEDYLLLGRLRDRLQLKPCTVQPVTQTIMRFSEYDRTAAEKLGGPYTGEGNRYILGTTATDDFGNYLFRFTQDIFQVVEEVEDVAVDEDLTTQIRPDIIIELMETLPDTVLYETAPYYNIQNIKCINLCLPSSALDPPRTTCQGGRAIQALGNLSIITSGTQLHSDGTVSNTNPTGPIVDHAAWYHTVDLFACFLDTDPKVAYYTLRYRFEDSTDWADSDFVIEKYTHPKQQTDGTWKYEKIGPLPVPLRVDGPAEPMVAGYAYLNIEDQITASQWQNTKRDRKLQIHTAVYRAEAGAVAFKIEGYDAAGEKVPGAEDTVKLYIDNTWSQGDIDVVKLGADDPGECALFELPAPGQPLTVRYRVTDPEGFMKSYALNVYRGSNTPVPTENTATGTPVTAGYQSVAPYRFSGTLDETLDPSGYVEISLAPSGGTWLPGGIEFCGFSFELTALDRKTNGYGTPTGRILWRELIGILYEPPTP